MQMENPASPAKIIAPENSGNHISSLDGVRGLAFCLVYFQHFAGGQHIHIRVLESLRGVGWTGVDLFFCLSGFLITGILFDTRNDPNYFRNFYARRALRIFPLYYLCLAVLAISTPLLHLQWHLFHLCYLLYCSNFLNALAPNVNTFGFVPWIDIGHFWSLAVEEQFYLVWPIAILLCRSRRAVIRLCMALVLTSILLRCLAIYIYVHSNSGTGQNVSSWYGHFFSQLQAPFFYKTFLYRITLFRFDSLASGGILAMVLRAERRPAFLKRVSWATSGLFCLSALMLLQSFHFETPMTAALGYTVLAMFYTSLIAAVICIPAVSRFFDLRFLRTIGKYSYGMYIFHQLARPALPFLIAKVAPIVGSIGLAASLCSAGWLLTVFVLAKISYALFESKFLRLKKRFAYAKATPANSSLSAVRIELPEKLLPAEPAYSGV